VLRAAGLGERVLDECWAFRPVRVNAGAEREVGSIVTAAGGRGLDCRPDDHAGPEVASRLSFVTRAR